MQRVAKIWPNKHVIKDIRHRIRCILNEDNVRQKPYCVTRQVEYGQAFAISFVEKPFLFHIQSKTSLIVRACVREYPQIEDNVCLGWIRLGQEVFNFGTAESVRIYCILYFGMGIFSTAFSFSTWNSISALEITFTIFIGWHCEGKNSQVAFFYYWIKKINITEILWTQTNAWEVSSWEY